jgi:hypothetical protein
MRIIELGIYSAYHQYTGSLHLILLGLFETHDSEQGSCSVLSGNICWSRFSTSIYLFAMGQCCICMFSFFCAHLKAGFYSPSAPFSADQEAASGFWNPGADQRHSVPASSSQCAPACAAACAPRHHSMPPWLVVISSPACGA